MKIIFSCKLCGIIDTECDMDGRMPDEPLEEWLYKLGNVMSRHHDSISPDCHPESLQNVQIPLVEGGYVGQDLAN